MIVNTKTNNKKISHAVSKYMTSKKTSLDETKLINSNEKKFKPGDGIKL